MARSLKYLLACLLLASVAHGQTVLLNKFGPSTGVLVGTAGNPATAAAVIADLQPILSTTPGLVLNGATGGAKGAGTVNATGLYVNGSAVGVGGGAVSSVGLTAPTCFGVTGSPVTSAGSLGLTLTGSSANVVRADGTCSAIAAADIQTLAPVWTAQNTFQGNPVTDRPTSSAGYGTLELDDQTPARKFQAVFIGSTATPVYGAAAGSVVLDTSLGVPLTLSTGDTARMILGATGNVAIPAPSSGAAVTITGAASSQGLIVTGNATSGQSKGIYSNAGTTAADYGLFIQNFAGTANLLIIRGDGSAGIGWNGSTNTIGASAAGNVTIAAPSSGAALSLPLVSGASVNSPGLQLANNSIFTFLDSAASTVNAGFIWYDNTNKLIFGTGNNSRMTVSAAGNVTIAAPSSGIAMTATGTANSDTVHLIGSSSSGQSFGLLIDAGSTSADFNTAFRSQSTATEFGRIYGDGGWTIGGPTGGDKGLGSINAQALYVNGNAIGTTASGSFTATLTGMTAGTTGTMFYAVTGGICTLWVNGNITGTSNSTNLTVTGLPAACTPVSQSRQAISGSIMDNSVGDYLSVCEMGAGGTTLTIQVLQTAATGSGAKLIVSAGGFTASGTKGILNDWTCSFPVQ